MKNPTSKVTVRQLISYTSELAQIKRRFGKILSAARASLDEAIAIGGLLATVKGKLPHGQWMNWAQDNLPFSMRRAEYWMNLFENRRDIKFAKFANLSSAYKPLIGPFIDVESEVLSPTMDTAPIAPPPSQSIWPDETKETIAAKSGQERSELYCLIAILEREPGFAQRMKQLLDGALLAEFLQLRKAA